MTTKWIVVAEAGDGTADYTPRYLFDDQQAALALSTRLNRASTSAYALHTLPEQRRGPDHAALYQCALAVLQSLDAGATPLTHYSVKPAQSYAEPNEGEPANAGIALFRAIRDLTL